MMKNVFNNRGEVATLVVVGLLVLVAVGTFLTTTLNQDRKTTNTRASESCTYDSGASIPLGQTETDASNAENRVPISSNRYYYDTLANTSGFEKITDDGVLTLSKDDSGPNDQGVANMMASVFGYKPKRLISALKPPNEGGTYILEVPTHAGNTDIKAPSSMGYDIGGGYLAMVTFAAADRVTLHIGRHEYFTGTKTCKNGKTCSGGYWIYIKNICVDKQIVNAYNSVKSQQEAAGADLNPIQLPMIRPGQILGKTQGSSVLVGVRDNGQFISIFKPYYWGGVSEVDTGTVAPTSSAGQTATPTPIPGATCGYEGYECCTPGNQTTNQINAACVTGLRCERGTCVVPPTPTPIICPNGSILCPGTNQCAPENICGSIPTNTPSPTRSPTPTPRATAQSTPTPNTSAATPTTQPSSSTAFTCNGKVNNSCYGPTTTGGGYVSCNDGKEYGIDPSACPNPNIPFCQEKGGAGRYCDGTNIVECKGVGDTAIGVEECPAGCDSTLNTCNNSKSTFRTNENVNTSAETVIYEGKPVLIL